MGTESHGSDYIWLASRSRFLLRFRKTVGIKDSRAVECDIVKVTKGNAQLFFSVALGLAANAQIPKEGTLSGTVTYAGTQKVMPLDKDRFVMVYENMGVRLEDSGQGPFHAMSTRNVGVLYFEKGVGRLRGYITNMDKDGDQILIELTEEASQLTGPTKGTGIFIGGTGKFTGIQGSMEYTRTSMRPVADGTHQAVSKFKASYKIVEPKK